jgi:hypothetical protein
MCFKLLPIFSCLYNDDYIPIDDTPVHNTLVNDTPINNTLVNDTFDVQHNNHTNYHFEINPLFWSKYIRMHIINCDIKELK